MKKLFMVFLLFSLFIGCKSSKVVESSSDTQKMGSSLVPDEKLRDELIFKVIKYNKSSECPLVISMTEPVGNSKSFKYHRSVERLKKSLDQKEVEDFVRIILRNLGKKLDNKVDKLFDVMYSENMISRNIKSRKTCEKDGYIFADKNTSEKYIKDGLYGAEIFERNPNVKEIFSVSYPVYDPERKVMIVYIEKYCGSLCGQGVYNVFWVDEEGIITPIGMSMAYMS